MAAEAVVGKRTPPRFLRSFPAHRERDDESGLMHFRARSYDPRVGRFVQKDPLLRERVDASYAYGANMPTIATDPTGLIVTIDARHTETTLMETSRGKKLYGSVRIAINASTAEARDVEQSILEVWAARDGGNYRATPLSLTSQTVTELVQRAKQAPQFGDHPSWQVSGGKQVPLTALPVPFLLYFGVQYEFTFHLAQSREGGGYGDWTRNQRLTAQFAAEDWHRFTRPITQKEKDSLQKIIQLTLEDDDVEVRGAAALVLDSLIGNPEAAKMVQQALQEGRVSAEVRSVLEATLAKRPLTKHHAAVKSNEADAPASQLREN